MKRHMQRLLELVVGDHLAFRVKFFNILAIAGIIASLISVGACLLNGESIWGTLSTLCTAVIAFWLLWYASRSGKYQRCYMIAIILVFLIFFVFIFFTAGGYHGAMPIYFLFAVMFTVFMLDRRQAAVMVTVQLLVYCTCCVLAYRFPQYVSQLETEANMVADKIIGLVTVSIILGITMSLLFRMYEKQQRELEAARDKALELSTTKTTFLANMSHEMRTPINVMLGMNEMILRESNSSRVTEYGNNIQSAGNTLITLVNNILDVSKIESGKLEIVEEEYSLADLIRELAVMAAEQAGKQGLRFAVEADENLPCKLYGDFLHIKQVVTNFISNAVKYTERGGVVLGVSQRSGSGEGVTRLRISVSDTGRGIRKEQLTLLFQAFVRADLPTHRYIEGSGLGLAIAQELTECMGGEIWVESEWQKGSVFTVELPQRIVSNARLGDWQVEPVAAKGRQENSFIAPRGRLLVVDDNKENIQVIRSLLGRTQLQVDAAQSGRECLEMARSKEYHLVLMDYMMPDMNGTETLRQLQREIPGFCTPVIALTANAIAGVKASLLMQGFAAYLAKPVSWKDLESAVAAHLPDELVTHSFLQSDESLFPEEEKLRLTRQLAGYGIQFEDGLHYVGGDIAQFTKLAQFFVESYAPEQEQAALLYERQDWQSLQYLVHSLKSKARALGASDLYYTAANLEKNCSFCDREYIDLALPLLYLEWRRAWDGLTILTAQAETLLPEQLSPGEAPAIDLSALFRFLRSFQRKDAEKILSQLLMTNLNERERVMAEKALCAVQTLDFDVAERYLREGGLYKYERAQDTAGY